LKQTILIKTLFYRDGRLRVLIFKVRRRWIIYWWKKHPISRFQECCRYKTSCLESYLTHWKKGN